MTVIIPHFDCDIQSDSLVLLVNYEYFYDCTVVYGRIVDVVYQV